MYEDFYGFSEGPFEFGPHPKFLCLTPSHAGALSGMLSGVRERKGITVITGDPGTGKTTLVNALLSELDEKVRTAFIVFTLLEFRDLLKSILAELGIRAQGRDTFALLQKFYLYLSERSQDESVVIIIDEAQGLDTSVLKDLMGLWTGPNPWYLQLQTVLLGQPELEAKLDSQELGSLREKIAVRRHIRPLTRRESNMYIDHRLRIVGSSSSEVFKPEAVDRICDCARGIPRVINMVCDGSLRIGYAKSKRKIDAAIVNEAIEDLRLFKPKEAKGTLPEPLPAEESGREEPVPEPIPVPQPRWRPVYQLLEWVRSLKPAVHPADGGEEPVPVLTTESVPEPLTLESSPEPLPVEEPRPGEFAPEPVPVPRLRWRPVYQTLAGALLGMVALGLFNLFIWDRVPREGMTVLKGTRTVIAEKGSTLSLLAEQDQGLVPAPSASVKRARPQRLVHKQAAPPQGQRLAYRQAKPPQRLAHDARENRPSASPLIG